MRICLPLMEAEAGGSGTFRRLWRTWLTEQNIAWTEDLNADYDILFLNAWQISYAQAYQQKKRLSALRVIHRIDGAGKDYGRTDGADAMQQAVNTLADATIFQSAYSRESTLLQHQIIRLDGQIIYNPVDADHYTPEGEKMSFSQRPKVITAIWSPNRRKGAWRLPLLAKQNPDIDFIFIGQAQFESIPSNLNLLGKLDYHQMAQALRSADVFLNLSENDPCPNIVLEAMASGLPVLYVPSGGTPELVGTAGLPMRGDADFRPQFDYLFADLALYQNLARQHVLENFAHDVVFPQYWTVIKHAARRPLPPIWRHAFSYGQMARVWVQDKIVNYRDWADALPTAK